MQKLRLSLIAIFAVVLNLHGRAQGNFYVIDARHSTLDFKVRHIGFSNVRGRFDAYEGNVYFNPYDLMQTSASVVVSTESIDTGAGGRNGILKEYFFEVEKHPYLIFNSTGVVKRGQDEYYMTGNLTMGAVTKLVEVPFELVTGPSEDQWKHQRISFEGELEIDRKVFGLFYRGNEFWDNVIEDKVKIEIEIGARVYNSLETVFPFRETSIGRMSVEGYQADGREGAKKKMQAALADPDNHSISYSQMVRGAGHLMQLGNTEGAIELLDLGVELRTDMPDNWRSEFLARKGQYLFQLKKYAEAKRVAEEALILDQNALGMEVLKQATKRL